MILSAILSVQCELFAAPGDKKWEFEAGRYVRSTPAIGSDGTVYFVANGSYALDGTTGEERWRYRGGARSSSPSVGANGIVYFGIESGGMVGLNQADGTVESLHRRPDSVLASPALALDERLYFENGLAN